MNKPTRDQTERIAQQFGTGVPNLQKELSEKIAALSAADDKRKKAIGGAINIALEGMRAEPADERPRMAEERIIALSAGARPVARIRDNKATTDFIGPDSEAWAAAITQAQDK